jgi:hypothetical protein
MATFSAGRKRRAGIGNMGDPWQTGEWSGLDANLGFQQIASLHVVSSKRWRVSRASHRANGDPSIMVHWRKQACGARQARQAHNHWGPSQTRGILNGAGSTSSECANDLATPSMYGRKQAVAHPDGLVRRGSDPLLSISNPRSLLGRRRFCAGPRSSRLVRDDRGESSDLHRVCLGGAFSGADDCAGGARNHPATVAQFGVGRTLLKSSEEAGHETWIDQSGMDLLASDPAGLQWLTEHTRPGFRREFHDRKHRVGFDRLFP